MKLKPNYVLVVGIAAILITLFAIFAPGSQINPINSHFQDVRSVAAPLHITWGRVSESYGIWQLKDYDNGVICYSLGSGDTLDCVRDPDIIGRMP